MKKTVLVLTIIVLCLFIAGCSSSSSGNYDKNDSYYYNNDKNKDGSLSDKEWGNAWNSYLNDKYNEYGY